MIEQPAFSVEPWRLTETSLQLDVLAQSESVFALSNGHIGLRGNLDEGEPHGLPGTYLSSFYELRPLPSAESAYGQSESSQTVVNVTNGKLIRLLVDDEPFDVRYGRLVSHRRSLDLRGGTLTRDVEWESPSRRVVALHTVRLVSLPQRAVAAIYYDVEARSHDVRLVIQSELVANETAPDGPPRSQGGDLPDPREASSLDHPLIPERRAAERHRVMLAHRTRLSRLRMAALMDHQLLEAPGDHEVRTEVWPDLGRVSIIATLKPGDRVRFVKYLAYGWSAQRSLAALVDQVAGAALAARHTGFDGLVDAQRAYLDQFWARADVEVEGDDEIQQAVRFALFHVLQSAARSEKRAIPAKGLTGPGYDGHAFWDTEMFVLPLLTATAPEAAADAIRWRHGTLPLARDRASQLRLAGAAFPWRSIHGEECSGYWPASTAAFHVNADVADATVRYLDATGDTQMATEVAVELLVQTARLWQALGHFDNGRGFRIDGVTGPDEYSAVADNNVYTNLLAQRNLRAAADMVRRYPDRAAEIGIRDGEVDGWLRAADAMVIPLDDELGVIPQSDGFTRHQVWDFDQTSDYQYPLMLNFPYFDIYRKQVVKQADLVMAMYVCGDAFSAEEKARNFDYYEAITVRDSSLSACIQAIMAAEVGHMDLAFDYLAEAALMDLGDLEHNTRDGLHMASLAGSWLALVAGFGGMRDHAGQLRFSPRLPPAIRRLCFRVMRHAATVKVEVAGDQVRYALDSSGAARLDEGGVGTGLTGPSGLSGPSGDGAGGADRVDVFHYGELLTLRPGDVVQRPIPPLTPRPAPRQPRGRAPRRRVSVETPRDAGAGQSRREAGAGGSADGSGAVSAAAGAPIRDTVDEWGEESFPASDPPENWSGPEG